jgi:uncharacterized membrane protein YfcA
VTGLTAGALTTSTGLNGPVLVLDLTGRGLPAHALRDTLAVIFLVLAAAAAGLIAVAEGLRFPDHPAVLLPAVVAGGLAGHALHDRMSETARSRAVTVVLVACALAAIWSALR